MNGKNSTKLTGQFRMSFLKKIHELLKSEKIKDNHIKFEVFKETSQQVCMFVHHRLTCDRKPCEAKVINNCVYVHQDLSHLLSSHPPTFSSRDNPLL